MGVGLALLLCLAAGGAAWLAQPRQPDVPWPVHAAVANGWIVTEVTRHPEYARFVLAQGTTQTTVEIVPLGAQASVSPHRHALQPAPGASPPGSLITWLTSDLRKWEELWPDANLMAPRQREVSHPARPLEVPRTAAPASAWSTILFCIWLLWLGSQVLEMAEWLKARPELRVPSVVGAVFGVCGTGLVLAYGPLPERLINVMHESGDIFKALSGQADHDGPLPEALRTWLPGGGDIMSLPRDAEAHLVLGVLAIAMFFVAAWQFTRSWFIAAALSWAWLTSPAFSLSATSELPTTLIAVLYLGSLPSFVALLTPDWRSPRSRSWLGLLCAAVLLVLTRPSHVLVPLLAGALMLVERWLGHTRIEKLISECRSLPRKTLGAHWRIWVVLLAFFLTTAPRPYRDWPGNMIWTISAVNPFDMTTAQALLAPFAGLAPAIPLLAIAGSVVLCRRAAHFHLAWLAVPVSVLMLYKLYSSASSWTYYEILRYDGYVAPLTMALAAVGTAFIWTHFSKYWQRGLVAAALLVPTVPALSAPAWDWRPDAIAWGKPLDRDRQRDARFILAVSHRWPSCTLVARVRRDSGLAPTLENHAYAIIGLPSVGVKYVPATSGLRGALARVDRDAGPLTEPPKCVLLLRTLDCNRSDVPSCRPDEPEAAPLMEQTYAGLPYANPVEHGPFAPIIRLAAWKLR